MRIKRLYIGDFGLYNNQLLNNLSPEIVIIGGLNRAGKSTLLQILRYLGYGFPRKSTLPPAKNRYFVEGDFVTENNKIVNLTLKGYSDPIVNIDGKEISGFDLYNNIDSFTYQRLFTINLDELQNIPSEVSKNDDEKLLAVLLGAGLTDYLKIPQLEELFLENANKLGGKYGSPKVKVFKPYYHQIKEGIRLRKDALGQVEKYRNKEIAFKHLEKEIKQIENELIYLDSMVILLDVLKNKYEDYKEINKINIMLSGKEEQELLNIYSENSLLKAESLKERYVETIKNYNYHLHNIQQTIGDVNLKVYKEKIINNKELLLTLKVQLSGLKEKIKNINKLEKEEQRIKSGIDSEIGKINIEWAGNYQKVLDVESDSIAFDILSQKVDNYNQIQKELKTSVKEIENLKEKESGLEKKINNLEDIKSEGHLTMYFFIAILVTSLGVALSFIYNWFGLFGLTGIIFLTILYYTKKTGRNSINQIKFTYELELKSVREQITFNRKRTQELKNKLKPLKEELEYYRERLGIDKSVSYNLLIYYFKEVNNIKEKIFEWQRLKDEYEFAVNNLKKELKPVFKVIGELMELIYKEKKAFGFDRLINFYEKSFNEIEQIIVYTEMVFKLVDHEKEKKGLEEEIKQLLGCPGNEDILEQLDIYINKVKKAKKLNELKSKRDLLSREMIQVLKTDKITKALINIFTEINNEDDLLQFFDKLYKRYTSIENVRKEYKVYEDKYNKFKIKLDSLKERGQNIKNELQLLATREKIKEANKKIIKARSELRPIAEEFATYKTAAFILNKVRNSFLNKTRNLLLAEASKTLLKITRGYYNKIFPEDDLNKIDFKVRNKDGNILTGTNVLSRGTLEQLFLSIRISRIKDITPPLPVVVDDSLVNFDHLSLKQTVEELISLSRRNQIFILTCHPHLVKYISERADNCQYWKLIEGNFNLTDGKDLVNYLIEGV